MTCGRRTEDGRRRTEDGRKPSPSAVLRLPSSVPPDLEPVLPMNTTSKTPSKSRRVVLLAGKPSHPTMMHEFNAGCILLKKSLDAVPGIQTALYPNGWPEDPGAFDGAAALFLFMDGGAGHAALQEDRLEQLATLVERGVGLGCAHYAVEVPAEEAGRQWQEWIGG